MFGLRNSPCCVFEPFALQRPVYKRRCLEEPRRNRMSRCYNSSGDLNYDVKEQKDQYVISLYKPVSAKAIDEAVRQRLMERRERRKVHEPRYDVISDFFGNQYYVQRHEEQEGEDQILEEVVRDIDTEKFGKQLARREFQDYHITLSHDGYVLLIESACDKIRREFELERPLEDVRVLGFEMAGANVAVLKLGLEKMTEAESPSYNKREAVEQIPITVHCSQSVTGNQTTGFTKSARSTAESKMGNRNWTDGLLSKSKELPIKARESAKNVDKNQQNASDKARVLEQKKKGSSTGKGACQKTC
ncbi:uncharacterized protein Ecym_1224 [Eremothecium cymbalariae DBVPG|uniref:Uncharacterized protein n=1 Tax=Eremothecium cymbalariae (strain CBS 270.75 / DBVPG 7215 / KCTC 17166 / NRRL Y-17582) TaxID=931890 RepID=G8JN07_ERECY|nr:hypothetical protein Ecym_1224 [Eremothecium cymbalariae DBVPG\